MFKSGISSCLIKVNLITSKNKLNATFYKVIFIEQLLQVLNMVSLKLGETVVERDGNKVYFIAEIGQNHQGNFDLAKKMILEAKKIGCDCVKFQKSCLNEKFTEPALNRPYESANSWGKTYGEHKKHLEFNIQQYQELQIFCWEIGIDFTASAMDEVSLQELSDLKVPFIKIGSGDANNFLLLKKAAKLDSPLVISTGMQTSKTIKHIVDIMHKANKINFALLHCVSSYPTEAKHCQLRMIPNLRNQFPQCVVGYSGHEMGKEISQAAVLLGARIVERHFTLDKRMKGSDHKCSLSPLEMGQLIHNTQDLAKTRTFLNSYQEKITKELIFKILNKSPSLDEALNSLEPNEDRTVLPCEMECRTKLGKSIVASRNLNAGQTITLNDLRIKVSEPNGISAEYIENVLGTKLVKDIKRDHPLQWNHLLNWRITKR